MRHRHNSTAVAIIISVPVLVFGCSGQTPVLPSDKTATAASIPGKSPASCCSTGATDLGGLESSWVLESERIPLGTTFECLDQHGREVSLKDRIKVPTALVFFYTRCENPNKCSRSVSFIGKLQQELKRAGIDKKTSLLLMTLEPEIDTPKTMADYAVNRGVCIDDRVQLLVESSQGFSELMEELAVPVSYSENFVAVHDVVLYLFDVNARVARTYSFVLPDPAQVSIDLATLIDESESN